MRRIRIGIENGPFEVLAAASRARGVAADRLASELLEQALRSLVDSAGQALLPERSAPRARSTDPIERRLRRVFDE